MFWSDERGGTATIFAVALFPILALLGVAIDYSRAASVRVDLQSAVDAAALAVGRDENDRSRREHRTTARQAFDAGFTRLDRQHVRSFKYTQNKTELTVEAVVAVPLAFGRFVGIGTLDVNARAAVPLGTRRLEIALVLDNTGSMAALGKMDALKEAAKSLLDTMQASAASSAEIAVVPFATQVNVGDGNRSAGWLRFEPGSSEPVLAVSAADWAGCVADRDQPYDAREPQVQPSLKASLHPAAICVAPSLRPIVPLTGDYGVLHAAIDAMTPTGTTNTTIGLAWGFSALTAGAPLSASARPATSTTEKVMIFLTDGDNTQSRTSGDRNQIDQRTDRLCDEIKKSKIALYTIRVIEGNETLLRKCATTPSMYYSITKASELKAVFDEIAGSLVKLRLTH